MPQISEGRPIFASGDKVSGRSERESTIEGDAEVRRAGTVVRADRITYYLPDDEVVAVGQVRMTREGNIFAGPQLQLKVDASEGFMLSPQVLFSAVQGPRQRRPRRLSGTRTRRIE